MTHRMLVIQPGQTIEESVSTTHAKSPNLGELQRAVGGCIETVPHLTSFTQAGRKVRCVAYADEEGRLKGLPRNDAASKLWRSMFPIDADLWYEPELVIFGPVALVFKDK